MMVGEESEAGEEALCKTKGQPATDYQTPLKHTTTTSNTQFTPDRGTQAKEGQTLLFF
jgi:hypothetical protein